MREPARLIDISPKVTAALAVWPGDQPPVREVALSFEGGDHLELSALKATVHLGAHADAPIHYHKDGEDIAGRDPSLYVGPAQVISVEVARGERILPRHLDLSHIETPRVLLKTGTYPDPEAFNEDFASLSPELIDALAKVGVRLVGIDTPSVDLFADKELKSHNAIYKNDMAVLEGIILDEVADGPYWLMAAPLALAGFDASPVRALLAEF